MLRSPHPATLLGSQLGAVMGTHLRNAIVGVPLAAVSSVGMVLATAQPANATLPNPDEFGFEFLIADCGLQNSGQIIARGKARSTVERVPDSDKQYYQKVSIRIDHSETTTNWRSLEKRSYSTLNFSESSYTTPGVRSVVGPSIANGENLRIRVDVKLKQVRTGPDKTVWKITLPSTPFTCTGFDYPGI